MPSAGREKLEILENYTSVSLHIQNIYVGHWFSNFLTLRFPPIAQNNIPKYSVACFQTF